MIGHERGRAGGLDSRWRPPLKDETWPALAGFFLEHAHHHHSGKLTRSRSRSFRCYISGNVPCRKCNDLAGLEIVTAESYPLANKSEGDGCDHRFADTNSPEPVGLGSGASSPRVQA